jgi:hypothetical protein
MSTALRFLLSAAALAATLVPAFAQGTINMTLGLVEADLTTMLNGY